MDAKQLAARLTGREYRSARVVTTEEEQEARAAGLVIVYGESDDLMVFRGAIFEEVVAYDGTIQSLTSRDGVLINRCDDEDCPYFAALAEKAARTGATIAALWCEEGDYSWTFRTVIPHETFEIVEDGEPFCRGIVFALDDVPY